MYRVAELYEYALDPIHIGSTDHTIYNTTITDTGALSASSGKRTGRVPTQKRIVEDSVTKDVIINFVSIIMYFIDHLVGKS
jgi:ATP-dependent phosphoenolpyruvate carboxykinase